MRDTFDRLIKVGDYITYSVGTSCNVSINIGQVMSVEDDRIKVRVIAGNNRRWRTGTTKYVIENDRYVTSWTPFEGRNASLKTSRHVLIINGVDALGMHDVCMKRQREVEARLLAAKEK